MSMTVWNQKYVDDNDASQIARTNRQQVDPHVSNFDWTDCLAGCEVRWGPGGREVDARRVTLWDPSMVLVQTQQEARGRWKSILI
jgi:hypothetical protein